LGRRLFPFRAFLSFGERLTDQRAPRPYAVTLVYTKVADTHRRHCVPNQTFSVMQVSTMNFTAEPVNQETVIIRIGKALDFRNASEFKSACQEQVRKGVRNFILDFSDTGILDSTGLGSIFSLYRQVSPLEGQVVFASVSRPVQVVVQLTRTYKVFRQFPTVDAAREALT
jgi:anti-sigma B factor antagonist